MRKIAVLLLSWTSTILLISEGGVPQTAVSPPRGSCLRSEDLTMASGSIAGVMFRKTIVVAGADSREVSGEITSDNSCKIRVLDSRTLFIATGNVELTSGRGLKVFDAYDLAHQVFENLTGDERASTVDDFAKSWGSEVQGRLSRIWSAPNVTFDQEPKVGEAFVKGFIVHAGVDGKFHALLVSIINSRGAQRQLFTPRIERIPTVEGIYVINPLYSPEVLEFFRNETQRAIEANMHWKELAISYPSEKQAAAQLESCLAAAVDWSGNAEVHGPIDIAILRLNGKIEWFARKRECQPEADAASH